VPDPRIGPARLPAAPHLTGGMEAVMASRNGKKRPRAWSQQELAHVEQRGNEWHVSIGRLAIETTLPSRAEAEQWAQDQAQLNGADEVRIVVLGDEVAKPMPATTESPPSLAARPVEPSWVWPPADATSEHRTRAF